jgi:hypothetical protein
MNDEGECADPEGHSIIVRSRASMAIRNDALRERVLASPDNLTSTTPYIYRVAFSPKIPSDAKMLTTRIPHAFRPLLLLPR